MKYNEPSVGMAIMAMVTYRHAIIKTLPLIVRTDKSLITYIMRLLNSIVTLLRYLHHSVSKPATGYKL